MPTQPAGMGAPPHELKCVMPLVIVCLVNRSRPYGTMPAMDAGSGAVAGAGAGAGAGAFDEGGGRSRALENTPRIVLAMFFMRSGVRSTKTMRLRETSPPTRARSC